MSCPRCMEIGGLCAECEQFLYGAQQVDEVEPSNQKDSRPSGAREWANRVGNCDSPLHEDLDLLRTNARCLAAPGARFDALVRVLEAYAQSLQPPAMLGCREHGTYCRAGYEIALAAKEEAERQLFDTLGFKIEPAELIEDITIRPNDESESTSAVVWCKSSPGMAASMLAWLWKEAVSLLQRQPVSEPKDDKHCSVCGKELKTGIGRHWDCHPSPVSEREKGLVEAGGGVEPLAEAILAARLHLYPTLADQRRKLIEVIATYRQSTEKERGK